MTSRYQVNEPHPTASTYIHSGRGGAGNAFRAPKTITTGSSAKGPASLFETGLPQTSSKFSSGRGGAGNIHKASDKAAFSFDEELDRQTTRQKKIEQGGIYHVGRGGAGNMFSSPSKVKGGRKDSSSSEGSDRSGFFDRLSGR